MKIVCVTGMHRSGTSLVGRVANLLGVHLGPEEELMAPKPDNPAGFWENVSIGALGDDLLGALGGLWSDPPVLEDGWESSADLDPFREQARVIIEGLTGDDPPELLGWKDPRTSLLLPFWRTVVPIEATIMTIRDPRDVAASLASRDGIEPADAAHLWLRYTVAAWRADPHRLVVGYDAFLDDPDAEVGRIVKHLGLSEPSAEVKSQINEFVDSSLRHFRDDSIAEGRAMATALAIHRLLIAGDVETLDVALESLHSGWVADREIELLNHRLESVTTERKLAEAHRDDLIEERDLALKERDQFKDEMERDREALEQQIRDVELQMHEDRAALTEQRDQLLAEIEEERATLIEQRDELTTQIEEERATLLAQTEELATQMENERATLTEQRDELTAQMEEERATLLAQREELTAQMEGERSALGTQIEDLTTQMEEERAALGTQIQDLTTQMEQERAALMSQRDELTAQMEQERAALGAQIEALLAQLDEERRVLTAQLEELQRHRDELIGERDLMSDRSSHLEARVAVQAESLARTEGEVQRLRWMLSDAEQASAELQELAEQLQGTIERWRVHKIQRIVWRVREIVPFWRSG